MTRRGAHHVRLAVFVVPVALLLYACAENNDSATETAATEATTTEPRPNSDPTTTAAPISAPSTTTQESPTMTAPQETSPASTAAGDDVDPCRRLTDFDDAADAAWFIVNDGVMGGRSNGVLDVSDSALAFSGSVVTDGGGFTSVRHRLDGTEMVDSSRLSMRVRSDNRVYGVTLEDDAEVGGRSVSHRADIDTTGLVDDDGWMIATVDYAALTASVFGRPVDAPPFNPGAAREVGIIIADGVDGDFSLEVDWIDVCE